MPGMPKLQEDLGARVRDYALGMIHESLWILGMSAFAFLMAVAVLWLLGVAR